VGVHAFTVREHEAAVEIVAMLDTGVLDYRIGHDVLVVTSEITTATRARLLVLHRAQPTAERAQCVRSDRESS
jgi:hypothetical protein